MEYHLHLIKSKLDETNHELIKSAKLGIALKELAKTKQEPFDVSVS